MLGYMQKIDHLWARIKKTQNVRWDVFAQSPSIMAELDQPNFDLFRSFGLDFFRDNELLLTETDLTEQKEITEQTEIGQLNDEDIDNFIT